MNIRTFCQSLIKLFLGQVNILQKHFFINIKRHRHDANSKFFCLCLSNSTVTVCHNRYFTQIFIPPFFLA